MIQCASHLLLIRPRHFGFNPETASSNNFQNQDLQPDTASLAIHEFDEVLRQLQRNNVSSFVFEDQSGSPDAVFSNNWICTLPDGKIVLFPMESPLRRSERNPKIIDQLNEKFHFKTRQLIDLTYFEKKNEFLEGTGSLVLDHQSKTAYVALSTRSHLEPLRQFSEQTGYSFFAFKTKLSSGIPVYHTNVMMNVGSSYAVVCSEIITNNKDTQQLQEKLDGNNKKLIDITPLQMVSFAGNMLEIRNNQGDPIIVLSETALKSLHTNQKKVLEQYASLLPVKIPTIEKTGGGSIRCILTEIFLQSEIGENEYAIKSPSNETEWEQYFYLRWKVLRSQWDQPRGSERDDMEDKAFHFMAVGKDGKIAGVGRLQSIDEHTAQVRYMGVDSEYQGKGVGRLLMQTMEGKSRKLNHSKIFLQARENAVSFYRALGYRLIEKTYLLFGQIQHYAMEKDLL